MVIFWGDFNSQISHEKNLFLFCLLFFTCSKNNDNTQISISCKNSVSINGDSYKTVVIGTQTWTAVNYNVPGGENYNNGATNNTYGKLYTEAEASAIVLPAGRRLPKPASASFSSPSGPVKQAMVVSNIP